MSGEATVAVIADPLPMTARLSDLAIRWIHEHRRAPITLEGLTRELLEIVLDGFIEQQVARTDDTDAAPAQTLDGEPINAHDLAFAVYAADRDASGATASDALRAFATRVCIAEGAFRRFLEWEGEGDAAGTRPGWTPLHLLVAHEGGKGWMASRGLRYPKFLKTVGRDRRSETTRAAAEKRLEKRIANIRAIVERRWARSSEWPRPREMAGVIHKDLSGLYQDPVAEDTIRQILLGTYRPMKKRGQAGVLDTLRKQASAA